MKGILKMNRQKILNVFIIFSFCLFLFSVYKFIEIKKRHNLGFYLLPVEEEIIDVNEKIEENLKKFYSNLEERGIIFENYNKFLKLDDEEKAILLKNYSEFLNFDHNTREKLRKIYKEIFLSDM